MSGQFFGNLTFGATTLYTNSGNMGHHPNYNGFDGFLALLDANLEPIWAKAWPVTRLGSVMWGSIAYSVTFDALNNVYGVGIQCDNAADWSDFWCYGIVSKHAATDGALMIEKVFEDTWRFSRISSSTDGSGDIFVTGKMSTSTGTGSTGASCEANSCALTMRLSGTDFSVLWARTIEGGDPDGGGTAEVILDATGEPFIYVAFQKAAMSGPVSLDSGTPYTGCKDDTTSVVTPAYEISMSKMVTSADCPAGSTFVDTDSSDAVWAASANTGVHCEGNAGDDCIVKYHAFTGLPEWAASVPSATSIVPMPDGTVHVLGSDTGAKFGAVKTPDTIHNWGWRAVIDGATGVGRSVSPFGGVSSGFGLWPVDATATSEGDLAIAVYFWGSVLTHVDHGFNISAPNDEHAVVMHLELSGPKVTPPCISTCTDDASTMVIEAGFCYIDGLCYADGDGVPEFTQSYADGNLCQICDVTQSQTSWSEDLTIVGVSECFIDGVCYKGNYSGVDAEFLSYVSDEDATPVTSICQYCDQTKDKNAWSVVEGYAVSPGENPPNDCQFNARRGASTGESDGASALGGGGLGLFAAVLALLAAALLQ